MDDKKENIENAIFFSLSLDGVTAIDNTSWICMRIYMVNDHIRHSYLLGIHKMTKSSTAKNIYELVIDSLKEIGGMLIQEDICGHPPIPIGPPPLLLSVFQFP